MAGIDTETPGFERIVIRPCPDLSGRGLTRARGSYDSIRGRIARGWELKDGALRLDVEIPVNVTATVFVPAKEAAAVREGGQPADRAKGLKFLRFEDGRAVYEAGSGRYAFESRI